VKLSQKLRPGVRRLGKMLIRYISRSFDITDHLSALVVIELSHSVKSKNPRSVTRENVANRRLPCV